MHTDRRKKKKKKLTMYLNPSVISTCFETKEIMREDLKHYTFNSNHISKSWSLFIHENIPVAVFNEHHPAQLVPFS